MSLRRLAPRSLRQHVRALRLLPTTRTLAADRASLADLTRLHIATASWGARKTVPVRLKPLAGATLELRPHSTDTWVVNELFTDPRHRAPDDLAPVRVVWDLGAYIGATTADFAVRHADAAVVGVEADRDNAVLARRNVASFGDRVGIVRAAVWHSDGEVAFEPRPDDLVAGHVVEGGGATVPAVSLDTLLERHTPGARVDYVKMDIEGAEREVLRRNTGWAEHVGTIKVEVHSPYTVDECLDDLRALGFDAQIDLMPTTGMPAIVGWRRPRER